MTIKIKYNVYFRTACIALFSLIFTSCTKDKLEEFDPGNATGKMVMVSLNVSLPPAVEPTSVSGYAVTKPFFRNRTNADSPFTVILGEGQKEYAINSNTRVSDGTTSLYNLWLFQFHENGSINGKPHKLSDVKTAINDMVTIDVPLVVADNQTLYLLVLGPKLDYDMSEWEHLMILRNGISNI